LQEAIYGRQLAGLLALLGRVMKDAGSMAAFQASSTIESATDWLNHAQGADAAKRAALTVLSRVFNDPTLAPAMDDIASRLARGAMEAISNPERGGEIGAWAKPIRERLGDIASRLAIDLHDPVSVVAMRPETGTAAVATMGKRKKGEK
jgi:hypothetical protein